MAMFTWREEHLVAGLARRLRRVGKGDGAEAFEAVNRAQAHMLRAAEAHVHRLRPGGVRRGGRRLPRRRRPRGCSAAVCDLYAPREVEADRGWFLEHGRLTPAASKAVTRAVDDLCRELRPHAGTVVAGLGIPTSWLGAEITDRPTDTSPAARMAG